MAAVSASQAVVVTPSDTVSLTDPATLLWVGTGGNVSVLTVDGSTAIYPNVPSGSYVFQKCRRVNLTGTTASGILAVYA